MSKLNPINPVFALVLAAVLLVPVTAARAQQDASLPAGKEVLDKYLEATGGREKYDNIKSRVSKSTIEVPAQNIKGNLTVYQQAPDKGYVETEIPGLGQIRQGYDGNVAWEVSAMRGPRLLEGQEKEAFVRSMTLGAETEPEKYYDKIETVGVEDLDGKPAYKVELTTPGGHKETRFYDKESGLLVRTQSTQKTDMGQINIVGRPTEYKEMGGIRMPTRMTQEMMGQQIVMTIDDVQHDVEIAADKFEVPAEVKALAEKGAGGTGTSPATRPGM